MRLRGERNRRAERGGVSDHDLPQCICHVAVQRNLKPAMCASVVVELTRDPDCRWRRAKIFQGKCANCILPFTVLAGITATSYGVSE